MVDAQLIDDFITGRYHWNSLPSHIQKAGFTELARARKEIQRLRDCIDAAIDADCDMIKARSAWHDAFNLMTHRTKA